MNINIPNDVKFIIDTFYNNGYEAYMVGGCVRDSLLSLFPNDYDITTSAPPNITENLFSKTIPTGIKHGTITIIINNTSYEVTTYRTESNYVDNRHPGIVTFVENIKEDLSRRDFTINAMAYNHYNYLVDYYNGLNDLNSKLITTVGNPNMRFREDALRMLRAIRFSSQLGFNIDSSTYQSIIDNKHLIENISVERINSELIKIILSDNANSGLLMLKDTKILNIILPNLNYNDNNQLDLLPKNLSIRLAYLLIDKNLDNIAVLKSLKFDNKTISKTLELIQLYPTLNKCNSLIDCKKLLQSTSNIFNLLELYEISTNTDISDIRNYINCIKENNLPIYIKDLNINGSIIKNELNISSGKIIGDVLRKLLDMVIEEKIENTKKQLLNEATSYIKSLSKEKE